MCNLGAGSICAADVRQPTWLALSLKRGRWARLYLPWKPQTRAMATAAGGGATGGADRLETKERDLPPPIVWVVYETE